MNNFQVQLDEPKPFFGTSFFDAEDAYHVKSELWRAANGL
jgi:hypothetical protein